MCIIFLNVVNVLCENGIFLDLLFLDYESL